MLRVALLYVALWGIGTAALLQVMFDREYGVGTHLPLPPAQSAAYDLPFTGINVALEQYEDEGECQERLGVLKQDGFGWVRQRLDWSAIEPQPGAFHWDQADAVIQCIRASGLVPVIVLDGSPAWARAPSDNTDGRNPLAPPADPHDFATFAGAFAARYADTVRFYQIWDEPNISPHWGSRWVNPVEYAQLLKPASEAIRDSDPDAAILLGALAPTSDRGHLGVDEVYFLQRLYAAGAQPYFDAVAVQPFGFGRTPHDSAQQLDMLNFQRVLLVRRAMVAAGDPDTPLVAVRFGWNRRPYSPWGAVDRTNQSRFAVDALELAYAQWPWLAGMGWAVDRPDAPSTDPLWGFSLNESLTEAIADWNAHRPPRETLAIATPQPNRLRWLILLAAAVLAAWRLAAALRILPLSGWGSAFGKLSPFVHVGIWALLLLAYYIATWPPLIMIYWTAAALLILAQPTAGLWLAAVTLPFYFQHKELQWGNVELTVTPAVAASLCLLPALIAHAARVRKSVDRWDLLAIGWLMVIAAGATGVWHWPAYWRGVLELAVTPLILFWAARTFARTGLERRSILAALVIGGTVAATYGLADWLRGGGTETDSVRRLVGPYFSANHTALYLERSLFLALGLVFFHRRFTRRLYALAALLLALALILTASRGAVLLGLPAGLIVLGLYAARRRIAPGNEERPMRATLIVLALVATGFVAAFGFSWTRLGNSATILERWRLWVGAASLWRDFWFAGIGTNGFFWRFPAYIRVGSALDPNLLHPHNLWLEYATTGGLLALAWLIIVVGVIIHAVYAAFRRSDPAPDWPAFGVLAALAAALAHAQVDAFAALPDLAAWNWMVVGVLSVGLTSRDVRRCSRRK